ncbi:MAG: hypothetical protein IPM76_15500 [Chloroflexi bacterium]|nr:hypothetical protein [Chloroflexota bacterium]
MLGISAGQRKEAATARYNVFFHTVIPWAMLFWLFFQRHLLDPQATYFWQENECVVTKSGKETRFRPILFILAWQARAQFGFLRFIVGSRSRASLLSNDGRQVMRTEEEKSCQSQASG